MTQHELKKAEQRRLIKVESERVIVAIREEWNALRAIENTLGQDVLDLRGFFEDFTAAGVSLMRESDLDDLIAYAKAHPDGLPHNHPDYER